MAWIIAPLGTAAFVAPISTVQDYLLELQTLLWQRKHPLFVGYIRAHSSLPGPLANGNHLADMRSRPLVALNTAASALEKAISLHKRFHLNAGSLRFQCKITKEQATNIVTHCPLCAEFMSSPNLGTNPRGVRTQWCLANRCYSCFFFWKVTICSCIYSSLIFASAHRGEKLRDAKNHANKPLHLWIKLIMGQHKPARGLLGSVMIIILYIKWVFPIIHKAKVL